MVSADAGAHSTGVTALFRSKKMSPLRSLVSMSLGMTPSWSGFTTIQEGQMTNSASAMQED